MTRADLPSKNDNTKGPLQMLSTLPDIVKQLNEDGRKYRQSELNSPPIFLRFGSNIVTVAAGVLACICCIAILIIAIKQFRLQSLVSGFGLVSLIPLTKTYYLAETLLTKSTEAPFYLARVFKMKRLFAPTPYLQQ